MSWNPFQSPQDYILLQHKKSPGIADVSGASLEWRLDVRRAYGLAGAIIIWTGRELSPFTVKLRLYTPKDWEDLEVWAPMVLAKPKIRAGIQGGVVSQALDIRHKLLEFVGIHSAVVKKVLIPERTTDDGEWTVTMEFLEFRGAPKPMLSKAEGSKSEPQDPVDRKIEELTKQVQKLAS